jgi:hypothetical protein
MSGFVIGDAETTDKYENSHEECIIIIIIITIIITIILNFFRANSLRHFPMGSKIIRRNFCRSKSSWSVTQCQIWKAVFFYSFQVVFLFCWYHYVSSGAWIAQSV